jgi:hypothetical protein
VAYGRTVDEVREIIGCDALIYQDVDGMKRAVGRSPATRKLDGFDASCFDGVYVTGDINAEDIARINEARIGQEDPLEENTSRLALPNRRRPEAMTKARRNCPKACTATRSPCAPALPPSQWGENSEALYLTSGFVQPDAETSAQRFANPQEGYTYGRTSNPTVTSFEQRPGRDGRHGGGHRHLHRHGRHPAARHGPAEGRRPRGLLALGVRLHAEPVRQGVRQVRRRVHLRVADRPEAEWKAAFRPNTKLLFAETPTNPLTEVCDIRALADIAHSAGALLAVDNCFCSPALQRPVSWAPTWSSTPAPSTWTARAA